MNNFIVCKDIFVMNYETKKIEEMKSGTIVKPRLKNNRNCLIQSGGILYELTIDMFKLFFKVLEHENI